MSSTQPSLTLFRGFADADRYTWSPFVNKLEARLRFGKVSYKRDVGSPVKAPRGKIPYVQLANEGQVVDSLSDSRLIIDGLVERDMLADGNARLSATDRALDVSVRALLEDKAYFYGVRERWVDNYYTMRDMALGALPYPIRIAVGLLAYRGIAQTLHGQGTTRYDTAELAVMQKEVWDSVNALVVSAKEASSGQKSSEVFWIFKGAKPTEADATVFGFISSALVCTAAPETGALVRTYPAILDYATRIHNSYFPTYQMWKE